MNTEFCTRLVLIATCGALHRRFLSWDAGQCPDGRCACDAGGLAPPGRDLLWPHHCSAVTLRRSPC